MAFDGIFQANNSTSSSTNAVSYGVVSLTPASANAYGVLVATNQELTPEGYKIAMVRELRALRKTPPVRAPAGGKDFLNWLNQP